MNAQRRGLGTGSGGVTLDQLSPETRFMMDRAIAALGPDPSSAELGVQCAAIPLFFEAIERLLGLYERVYFIQSEQGGPIKIGRSRDIAKRIKTLQVGSPSKLRLIGWMPEQGGTEESLHARYAPIRLHGEWFQPGPELVDHIRMLGGNPA